MAKTYTFSDIKFGTVYLDPIFDESGQLADLWFRIDAGLKEDEGGEILVKWGNYNIPLTTEEKTQVVAWLKNTIRPKVMTFLGL